VLRERKKKDKRGRENLWIPERRRGGGRGEGGEREREREREERKRENLGPPTAMVVGTFGWTGASGSFPTI